jgi:hypothetical protein
MESNSVYEHLTDKDIVIRLLKAIEDQARSLDALARTTARIADALEFIVKK